MSAGSSSYKQTGLQPNAIPLSHGKVNRHMHLHLSRASQLLNAWPKSDSGSLSNAAACALCVYAIAAYMHCSFHIALGLVLLMSYYHMLAEKRGQHADFCA